MLQILGKASSINVRKVLWTCDEIGLAPELVPWGSGVRSPETAEFKALNPNAMVPVLKDDAFVLWESNVICRYLAGKHKREDLLPRSAHKRALVEQWMDWQASELNVSWRYAFMAIVRESPAHQDLSSIEAGVAGWNRHMQILDAHLQKTRAYAAGAAFTLADVVLGLSTHRWLETPMQRPELAAVADYYQRLLERPAFVLHARKGVP